MALVMLSLGSAVAQGEYGADLTGAGAVFGAVGLGPLLNAMLPLPAGEAGTTSLFVGTGPRAALACHRSGEGWLDWEARQTRCLKQRPPWHPADRAYGGAITAFDHTGRRMPSNACARFKRSRLSPPELAKAQRAIGKAGVLPMAIARPTRAMGYEVDFDGDGRVDRLWLVLATPDASAYEAWEAQRRAQPSATRDPETWDSTLVFLRVTAAGPRVVGHQQYTHFLRDKAATCTDVDGDGRPELGFWLNGDSELEHALFHWNGQNLAAIGSAGFGD